MASPDSQFDLKPRGETIRTFKYLYLLLSFCTSLSSSSFSLVIKLCSTGISNFMYCATWWLGGKTKIKNDSCGYSVDTSIGMKKIKMRIVTYIIRDFLSQILLHQEDFADLLARTLDHSQHQRVIAALQLHALCSENRTT